MRFGIVNFVVLLIAFEGQARDLNLVVTPGGPLSCKFQAVSNPPVVENDLIKYRIVVEGGQGPYEWRLPLYKTNNGFNDVRYARVGKATLNDDGSFPLDLLVSDVEKLDQDDMEIMVRSRERFETRCKTPAKMVRQLARSTPAKQLILEGGVR